MLPCQDTPSIRLTFTASLDGAGGAARGDGRRARRRREVNGGRAIERFEMPQPIPPYLFAFAVGDLASKDLSPRSRVWAEPAQLEAAAWEFAHVEDHLRAAEALFGPYDWERFDLLVMPPSFPYGGMENPRLTFLTPTLLAGDRSLVNVVAHELAHSWTGNLVTNANAEHFWLNEGFTVYAERRILEALEGAEMAALHAALGRRELEQAFAQLADHPELTKLRTHLTGIDPDEAFSQVPYEKGYLFLKALEAAAGREAFDRLLATWLGAHRFGAATTDDFLALVERVIPGLLAKVDAKAWIDGAGLPATYWRPSPRGSPPCRASPAACRRRDETKAWSATEWQLYLEAMPRPSPLAMCEELDAKYALTASKNPEVLVELARARVRVGLRRGAAARRGAARPHRAHEVPEAALPRARRARARRSRSRTSSSRGSTAQYHPIAQQVIRGVLK